LLYVTKPGLKISYHITVSARLQNAGIQYFACLCFLQNILQNILLSAIISKDAFLSPQTFFWTKSTCFRSLKI